ncbi:hypothetical protein [Kitasatospora sp. HPMI-4]|uniref:hypothetical protein n=1 Tax=Kitasatospora sp. HPMI-4 TaxID=3448443 RepID=UPI003F1CB34A
MTVRRPASLAKKSAAAAALVLAVVGTAATPAFAARSTVIPCADDSVVKLPGESPVADAPVHQGSPTLTLSSTKPLHVEGDTAVWEYRLTETNNTGAGYQHVTPVPAFFTQLGVIGTKTGTIEWMHDGQAAVLPTHGGCDPSAYVNSAALDGPLADGQSRSFDLRIKAPADLAKTIKYGAVFAYAGADGDISPTSGKAELPALPDTEQPAPSEQPSTGSTSSTAPTDASSKPATEPAPTKTSTTPKAPAGGPADSADDAAGTTTTGDTGSSTAPVKASVVDATVPRSSDAPTTPATPATTEASLASTGGGGNSTGLVAGALALIAAGTVALFGLRRRARRS